MTARCIFIIIVAAAVNSETGAIGVGRRVGDGVVIRDGEVGGDVGVIGVDLVGGGGFKGGTAAGVEALLSSSEGGEEG